MQYPDAINPELLIRIPLNAKFVLDVGCGSAATLHEYKHRNPDAQCFGIEKDAEAAALAAIRLDRVAHCDVESDVWIFGSQNFDCIIFGDTLEHLVNPWKLLKQMTQRLTASGVVLICMPNLEHWSFAARLLRGGWNYHPMGLFDASHLRWFTRDTTRQAIGQAGLVAHDVVGRVFDAAECDAFVQSLEPGLRALNIDPADYHSRALPLQYVWRALAAPVSRMNVVSTVLSPVGGVSEVRVFEPMAALASLTDTFSLVVPTGELPQFEADSPKIFIFHRPLLVGDEGLLPIRQLIDLGYVVVCEFDDHPDFIPVLQKPDVQNFRCVHAVQTTTPELAEVLGRENPEIKVFPNAIARLPEPRNFQDPNRLTLFFGSLNRESEWPLYLSVLNDVIKLAGSKLHFDIVNDDGLFRSLETEQKSFTPLCDYETYKFILAKCEISFMPLSDTPFNRCKSDLKYIEAASHRVAALASPTVYGESIEDGITGVIFSDPADFRRRLLAMIANPEQTRRIADAALQQIKRDRMLSQQIGERAAWYRDLWSRRNALNAALLSRVPELADVTATL